MKTKVVLFLILSVLFTAIGLVCGWYGASHTGGGSDHGAAPQDAADTSAGAHAPALSETTLKNMGVRVAPAKLTSYSRHHSVSAIVAPSPGARQGVYAPSAGRVRSVETAFGAMVESGEILVTLVRAPLPRATLELTGDVLKPVSENLHETLASLQRATMSVEILKSELKRLDEFSGSEETIPILPQKEIIQLRYELIKAERELSIVEHELERHGLDVDQMREVAHGNVPPVDSEVWLGALQHNGFWSPLAREIHAALPEKVRKSCWAVATIAELTAGDLADRSLQEWLASDEKAGLRFLEIGGLLQRGHSLANIRELHELGALDPVMRIRAPETAADWDVREILVRPGQWVEEGEELLCLDNPRCLHLRAEPTQGETKTVLDAMQAKVTMDARPIIPDASPILSGLAIRRVFHSETESGTAAYVTFDNTPLFSSEDGSGRTFRTWSLREGQRYELLVPTLQYDKVYVFPGNAVVDDGPDKVLFLKSGDSFRKIPVEILYHDHEVVVLPASSDIFPGNPIVTHGALALSLALDSGGSDPTGGHGHAH